MNKKFFTRIVESDTFNIVITIVIILNSLLVGIQTVVENIIINTVQEIITFIFVTEILVRFLGARSIKAYFKDGWNWFDIIIVGITHVPDLILAGAGSISGVRLLRLLRVLRTLRVLRLFRVFQELTIMIRVLIKSFRSVMNAGFLLFIFTYIYAIIGVILFKGHMTIEKIDPFEDIGESFFSLFRIATGDGWTTFRYDLYYSVKDIPSIIVNIYFISWHVISAFLLLNIVFGAVISNYEQIYNQEREKRFAEIVKEQFEEKVKFENIVLEKLEQLSQRLSEIEKKNNINT